MDNLTRKQRSKCMSRITSKNTEPERRIKKILTAVNIKYKLHVSRLPGKPDIVIGKQQIVIFVNGCFWHQHMDCNISRMPKSHTDYWKPKLTRNIERQKEAIESLNKLGYKTLIYWECETENPEELKNKILKDINYESKF